jgi:glucokinase
MLPVSQAPETSVLVYDIGGSHVAAAVCTGTEFRLGKVISAAHPVEQTSEAFLNLLHRIGLEALGGNKEIHGAELAFPGPFDYAAGISRLTHKMPYTFGVNLRSALATRFGWEPAKVRFLNDAAAYLLGEVGAGAGRGVERVVCITLGTGIGSGFAVHGQLVTTGRGVTPGGEIWDYPYEGGILEDVISSRALQASYQERTGILRAVAEIAAAAPTEKAAAEVFTEFGQRLGVALRTVLATFAPQVIVLGGGISRSAHLFISSAEQELRGTKMELRISSLMDNAPLVGAGVEWFLSRNLIQACAERGPGK